MWSADMAPRRRVLALASAAALAGLSACGFELRRPARVSFGSIALQGAAPRSTLVADLLRVLAQQVRVLDGPEKADVVLQVLLDQRERSVVAQTAAAQVRDLQLRLKFNFRAHTPSGRELIARTDLLLTRDLSYSETRALAKEFEEAELFRDMQADVVSQVMRRLAALQV
jgi:LPS-assembly lipoprotein